MAFLRLAARWLKPAEIVLLAFLTFFAFKLLTAPHIELTPGQPPKELFLGMLLVVTLQTGLRYRALPWPDAMEPQWITRHRVLLPFALLPIVLEVLYLSTFDWSTAGEGEGDLLWRLVATGLGILMQAIRVTTPALLVWFALGLHLKRRGGLSMRAIPEDLRAGAVRVARDWAPPLLLIFSYRLMGLVLNGQPSGQDRDPELIAIDRFLFLGHDPVVWFQSHTSLWLLEWMTFVYGVYFALYPLCFGSLYLLEDQRGFAELSLAICLALALGYIGYTVVPAQGPVFAEHLIPNVNNLQFKAMTWRIEQARIQRDAFPSLHTATSVILLWAVSRHRRALFWVLLPIVASIPLACVYLGWHYVTDILAGLALARFATWLAPRWLDFWARAPVPVAAEAGLAQERAS